MTEDWFYSVVGTCCSILTSNCPIEEVATISPQLTSRSGNQVGSRSICSSSYDSRSQSIIGPDSNC